MKKTFFIMLAALFMFASCANASQKQDNSVTNNATEQAAEEGAVKHLTKAEFIEKVMDFEKNTEEWVYRGSRPAIIDFYATWCGPCKQVAPVLEELAKEYAGKIDIYKVDVDQEKELAAAFGIRSIPTILFVPMKGDPQVSMGALPKETFKKAIDEFLLEGGK